MLKYLTADIPGAGGVIKETPEDFLVAEIPLYHPEGSGEHTYAEIEKRGITTLEAIRRLSRALNIAEREIGSVEHLQDQIAGWERELGPRRTVRVLLGFGGSGSFCRSWICC